jgi:hypothetical protein
MKKRIILITTIFLLIANSAFADMSGNDWDKLRESAANGSTGALTQIKKEAKAGGFAAEFELGLLYANGQGVPQDYAQAASWFRKAAEQGNADAQNNLGVLYDKGQGVPQDYTQAASWYRKAAEQGNALAQYNLGIDYTNGRGVMQSNIIAYALWNASATNDPSVDNSATKKREIIAARMSNQEITAAQRLTVAMMESHNLLAALDHYERRGSKKRGK